MRLAEREASRPAEAAGRAEQLTQLASAYASAGDAEACGRLLDEALKLRRELRAARIAENRKRRAAEGLDQEADPLDERDENGLPLRLTMRSAFDDSNLSHIAYALARGGHSAKALAIAEEVDPQETEDTYLWVIRGVAAAGDADEARRVAERLRGEIKLISAARWGAEEFAQRKRFVEAKAWAESRAGPRATLWAYLGIVEGMLGLRFWEPRLGF